MKTLKLFNRFLTLIMVLVAIGFSSCSKLDYKERVDRINCTLNGDGYVTSSLYLL